MQKEYCHITEWKRSWMSNMDNDCMALLAAFITANLPGKGPIKEWNTANILRIMFFISTQTILQVNMAVRQEFVKDLS